MTKWLEDVMTWLASSTVLPQVTRRDVPRHERQSGRIGGSAFTAHSGEPGCAAGAASAKHQAARANRSGQGLYAQKIARLCRRSFGLPTARAPAHNLPGQQGLKISIPTIDCLAGGSVQRGLSAAGGER